MTDTETKTTAHKTKFQGKLYKEDELVSKIAKVMFNAFVQKTNCGTDAESRG